MAPAGYVSIEGRFAWEYHNELILLVQHTERRAKADDPMQRIMSIDGNADSMKIATTDIRLARAIGETLHEAYKGDLDFHYDEDEYTLRVRWQRWT